MRNRAAQLVRTQRYKLYASGRFFDVEKDPLERSPIAPDAVPGSARKTYEMLRTAIERHVRDTKVADPIQRLKRRAKPPSEIEDPDTSP